jgi:hypothetical protein
MKSALELEADVRELTSAVLALSEATHRALSLIEIAHRRELAKDPGYQDLISEATRYASQARSALRAVGRPEGRERAQQPLRPHKYL